MGDRGINGQATAEFFDETTKVLFYTQVNKDGIGCWNSQKPYTEENQGLVDSDSDALVFPNDLKVDNNGTLWVLSDRMPIFLYKQLDPKQFNYRILRAKTSEIIQGTPCAIWARANRMTITDLQFFFLFFRFFLFEWINWGYILTQLFVFFIEPLISSKNSGYIFEFLNLKKA